MVDDPSRSRLEGSVARAVGADDEVSVLRAMSAKYRVPAVDVSRIVLGAEALLLPRDVAVAHRVLPLRVRDDQLLLAMADPSDAKVVDEVEFVTGKRVFAYVASPEALEAVTQAAYDAFARGDARYAAPRARRSDGDDDALALIDASPAAERLATRASIGSAGPAPVGDESMLIERASELPPPPTDSTGTGKVVLVVDDEPDIRKLVCAALTARGHRVLEADRGSVALQLVARASPDLVILDAMMPEVHGFDIARRIRRSTKYASMPIVMVSAVYRGWRVAEDLKASYGIDAFLEKPFKVADVLSAVERALARVDGEPEPPSTRAAASSEDVDRALSDGLAAFRAGDPDAALAHFRRGVAIDPLSFPLRYQLGLLYANRGMVFDALGELEQATELRPKHFAALKNLAVLYEEAGFRRRALEVWERSVARAPDEETRARIKEHILALLG